MHFNRETEADRAAKDFAQRQAKKTLKKHGGKAAKAAGKAAGKITSIVAQRLATVVAGAIGGPVSLVILAAVLVLIILPSMIFSSGFGADSKYNPSELANTSVGSTWEDDAENAINERYADLKIANFWEDLGTFFTTGQWGQTGARFETEFANAKDADEEGTNGYFSSSNRLIAIINEAFRLSLKNSRIESEAIALANQTKVELEEEIRSSAEYGCPSDIASGDYTIEITIEEDPAFNTDQNFIYESCYMLAASSGTANNEDSFGTGVRVTLDKAFSVTGLDGNLDKQICWEASVSSTISPLERESYTVYKVINSVGVATYYPTLESVPESDRDSAVAETRNKAKVKATIYYTVNLKPNYQDIINERCGIEDALPEGTPAYEITQEEQVKNSALELSKFYGIVGGNWAEIGEAGLPLPRGSYYISSEFGWRILRGERDYHEGIDLAAPAGTPIYAVKDGVCTVHPFDGDGYGYYVTIDHGDGIKTRYAHMSAVAVTDGQTVTAGEIIGYVGSTGNSTGPHLHFEVWSGGSRIDPLSTELGPEIRNASK